MKIYKSSKNNHQLSMAWWKKLLCINYHHTTNLNFIFLLPWVQLFKKCPSQFLIYWELAEPVFCSEELSCLPYKNQNKSLSVLLQKIQICCMVTIYTQSFFHQPTFNAIFGDRNKKEIDSYQILSTFLLMKRFKDLTIYLTISFH